MYAPTAAGVYALRWFRARAKMTRSSPAVATTSDRRWGPVARTRVEMVTACRENITLAVTAPTMHPATWAGRWAAASRHEIPPKAASTRETTGLKCAPERAPKIRMSANRPAPVTSAFCNRSRPVSPGGSCWAAIPEPITTAARSALPRNSATRRRHSAAGGAGGCSGAVNSTPQRRGRRSTPRCSTVGPRRGLRNQGRRQARRRSRCASRRAPPPTPCPGVRSNTWCSLRGRSPVLARPRRRGGGHVIGGGDLDSEMVERTRLADALDEDELEWGIRHCEVGVPGAYLGRTGPEQGGIEAHRVVQIRHVEGELHTGHGHIL